ncbi:MAG: phenylalanine--tRNA ligase subunit alpha [Methanomicrobiales archaeon]|nr:phenylalanine--tRNA ligase subunit alpha [Methanomicrobiales archaeon]
MAELTQNEKRLLVTLAKKEKADAPGLAAVLGATPEAVVQWAHLARDNGLVTVERKVRTEFVYTDEGKEYLGSGLPETQLLAVISAGTTLDDLKKHPAFKIGIGQLRKKGLIKVDGTQVAKAAGASTTADEAALKDPKGGGAKTKELVKRGLIREEETVRYEIAITPEGRALVAQGLDLREETGTLSREQIISGEWKNLNLRKYDVTKLPKKAYCGKVHPYQRIIAEMREILLEMGFEELYGGIVQQSYWNFDALFQPQDHPAREMQDTFYLNESLPLPQGYEKVRAMHLSGGDTSSTGWGGAWKEEKAEQCVLRTHTTCLSVQHLAQNRTPPVKAFAVGRVYRRETIDTTHLAEFEQLEGIVMDENVTFGNLLGILREFYHRMGFTSVRFKPSYYPYTEPSLDAEVYVEGIGWIEMGGAGIFREEVTAPLGITCPVLAWGLGVSRIAMLRLGLKDLRLLHKSDVAFLRETPMLRPNRGGI